MFAFSMRFLAPLTTWAFLLSASVSGVAAQDELLKLNVVDEQAAFQHEIRKEIANLEAQISQLKSGLQKSEEKSQAQNVCGMATEPATSNGAQQNGASEWRGSFPGSIKIPDSPASVKIGGFVKVDAIHDFDAILSRDNFNTTTIFTDGRDGESSRIHARWTRLNLDTRWQAFGREARAFIEGDFFSDNDTLRLRFAYGEWGPWLVGQTWTAFTDVNALPYTLDFESPAAFVLARRATIRWTGKFNERWSVSAAVEDPRVILSQPAFAEENIDFEGERFPWPDLVARVRYSGTNAEHQFAGILHFIGFQPGVEPIRTQTGWGLAWSGYWQCTPRHRVSYEVGFGPGIGNLRGLPEAVPNPMNNIDVFDFFGATAGYQIKWTERLSSNLVFSYGDVGNIPPVATELPSNTTYIAANLVWRVSERIEIGGEYLYGQLTETDGATGDANRIQMSFRWFL